MGLTKQSSSRGAIDHGLSIERDFPEQRIVALAGNPNVGKSTVFNSLTGMKQHTGNWPGKTVASAQGNCRSEKHDYILVDIPGTYSLMAHSPEEEIARDFLCFSAHDAVIVVCDATCLERNLNLVLQTLELTDRVIVCLNLMDEAKRKGIHIDANRLATRLGVPVVPTVAHNKADLQKLLSTLDTVVDGTQTAPIPVRYSVAVESAVARIAPLLSEFPNSRWLALRLLEQDDSLLQTLQKTYSNHIALTTAKAAVDILSFPPEELKDTVVETLTETAETIAKAVTHYTKPSYNSLDRRIDRRLTSKVWGYPLMLLLLALVFWLTINGANYPSTWLSAGLFWIEDRLSELFTALNAPPWLHGAIVHGAYRVSAWVISVMLPPMAIFFPLFTLLEDVGYLPRIAYNLDRPFRRCNACGKQALTMCMGFGCNAAGVVGCRIIDSPRERLLAIITNNFVPCNGRFPTLLTLITLFLTGKNTTLLSAVLLTVVILIGILATFGATRLLSATVLKGIPSSFTLELPPYRRPQLGRILVRSLFDRTLFVLGRSAMVAAPAGLILWCLANITIGEISLLSQLAAVFDPFARLMGLDGAILIAFILGFPANEIVIPIVLMIYLSQGALTPTGSLDEIRTVFLENGWTWTTAVSTLLFSLFHWPCSTTLLTIHRETGSVKWTALAFLLPTVIGITVCILFNLIV